MNNVNEIFMRVYERTIKTAEEIASPYEKATIYASVLNSLSRIVSGSDNAENNMNISSEEDNNIAEETIENTETEETVEVTEENTEAETSSEEVSVIDSTSEDDDDTWTDRMKEKYAEIIDFVNSAIEYYGKEEIEQWLVASTNGLYTSFDDMDPQTYIATVERLNQSINSNDEN